MHTIKRAVLAGTTILVFAAGACADGSKVADEEIVLDAGKIATLESSKEKVAVGSWDTTSGKVTLFCGDKPLTCVGKTEQGEAVPIEARRTKITYNVKLPVSWGDKRNPPPSL